MLGVKPKYGSTKLANKINGEVEVSRMPLYLAVNEKIIPCRVVRLDQIESFWHRDHVLISCSWRNWLGNALPRLAKLPHGLIASLVP